MYSRVKSFSAIYCGDVTNLCNYEIDSVVKKIKDLLKKPRISIK